MANLAKYVARLTHSRSIPTHRFLYSTVVESIPSDFNLSERREGALFNKLRILEVSADGSSSALSDVMNKWVEEGVELTRRDLAWWITRFRKSSKYGLALQISEWMEKSTVAFTNDDQAIHIKLLYQGRDLAEAEKYFLRLQPSEKTIKTIGALIGCYCGKHMTEKAVEMFEQMKELGIAPGTYNVNHLMSLYLKDGKPEKILLLAQEMEDSGVSLDKNSYKYLMNSYADLKDYDSVEKVLEIMMLNKLKLDWSVYATLARIYINAGFFDKANVALRKIEKKREALPTLIDLYAQAGNSSGVTRAWKLLKLAQKSIENDSYLWLTSLSKIWDLDGLEKYFKEWESSCSQPDVKLYNVILESYLSRDMLPEARKLSENMAAKEVKPDFQTYSLYIDYLLKKGKTDMAVLFLEQGASKMKEKHGVRFPGDNIVSSFMKSLEENKDAWSAQKFFEIMKGLNRLNSEMYGSLSLFGVHGEPKSE